MTIGYKDPLTNCICLPNQGFACIYCEVDNEVPYDLDTFQHDEATKKVGRTDDMFRMF